MPAYRPPCGSCGQGGTAAPRSVTARPRVAPGGSQLCVGAECWPCDNGECDGDVKALREARTHQLLHGGTIEVRSA